MKFILFACLALLSSLCSAYIISSNGLPRQKQRAWLNKLTDNLCSTAPGELSHSDVESAHDMIYAWARASAGSKECAIKVESLVKRVIDERRAGNLEAQMTLSDYNLLLEGWARSRAGTAAAERCEQIMTEMQEHSDIKPNPDSFKSVLMSWRVSNDVNAAVRAQGVLEYMISLYASGKNPQALPDSDCFDICLQLWARSGRNDAPQQTEQLLIAMERLYHATGQAQVQPQTTSFNAVLAAWSKSRDQVAVQHILEILRFMETHAKLGDTAIEPDMVSYSTCVSGIARLNGPPQKAESLLRQVETAELQDSNTLVADTILYNTVINCWARTARPGAYRKARSVLDRQMNHYHEHGVAKPDVYGFTSVLASCAMEPKEKAKAFKVAIATFQQLRHSQDQLGICPNHVTYGTIMKCCARLLAPSNPQRNKWAKTIMAQCIEDGAVGDMVMSRFREAARGDVFRELMDGVDKKNLPEEWTRNVDEKRDCRKRKSIRNNNHNMIKQQQSANRRGEV